MRRDHGGCLTRLFEIVLFLMADPGSGCQASGAKSTVSPVPGQVTLQGHVPTVVTSGRDAETGDERVLVSSPAARSENRVTPVGRVSLTVEGSDAGRSAEPTVLGILQAKLNEQGIGHQVERGRDWCGEDGILMVGSHRLVIQVVTGVPDPSFWKSAKTTSASRVLSTLRAAELLENAIAMKARTIGESQARSTLLVIDARHAGALASAAVLADYARQFGDPAVRHQFSAVWIVGPTVPHTTRLGSRLP